MRLFNAGATAGRGMFPGNGGCAEIREGAAFAKSTGTSGPPSSLNKAYDWAPGVSLVPSQWCRLEGLGHPDSSRDLFCRQEEQKKKDLPQKLPRRPQKKPPSAWSEPEDSGAYLRVSLAPAFLPGSPSVICSGVQGHVHSRAAV